MSNRSIKSAERTLALFELFACRERPLCVGEIAHGLEIPQRGNGYARRARHRPSSRRIARPKGFSAVCRSWAKAVGAWRRVRPAASDASRGGHYICDFNRLAHTRLARPPFA